MKNSRRSAYSGWRTLTVLLLVLAAGIGIGTRVAQRASANPARADALAAAGVTGIIELAPAGALVGLAKRGLKGVPSVAVKTPDDLNAAFDLIDGN